MHEYSIVQALVERVEREARAHGATAVHALRVRVGEQSGVDPELLASAYELVRARTCCAGAPLEVERVPVRWGCSECGEEVPVGAPLRCPTCGGPAALVQGDEIVLERLELEVP